MEQIITKPTRFQRHSEIIIVTPHWPNMEGLMQCQILDSFRLSLPEGLKDLMNDISREVLRAQPHCLYTFITDYLEALLISRETLSIASYICRDVCTCCCQSELDEELRDLGLSEEDMVEVKNVVAKYFDKGKVIEANLLMKLLNKAVLNEHQAPAVIKAIRRAYLKHLLEEKDIPILCCKDEATTSAIRTMDLYKNSKLELAEQYDNLATKIQAAYRGYLVRRNMDACRLSKVIDKNKYKKVQGSKLKTSISTISSTSLAGSFLSLPKYVPYSATSVTPLDYEDTEKERGLHYIDYTDESYISKTKSSKDSKKKIVFHDVHETYPIPEDTESGDSTVNDVRRSSDQTLDGQFVQGEQMPLECANGYDEEETVHVVSDYEEINDDLHDDVYPTDDDDFYDEEVHENVYLSTENVEEEINECSIQNNEEEEIIDDEALGEEVIVNLNISEDYAESDGIGTKLHSTFSIEDISVNRVPFETGSLRDYKARKQTGSASKNNSDDANQNEILSESEIMP